MPPREALRNGSLRDSTAVGAALAVSATLISLIASWHVSLWADEAATITAATRTLPQLWFMLGHLDVVHGLYYLFMHVWTSVFGVSAVALRLPSALAVGAAAFGVWRLGRQLDGPVTGLCAGLVFAVTPRATWMGIEARPYAFTAVVAVWLTVLMVSVARGPGIRIGRLIGYAVLAGVGITLNIYLLLLVAAHGLTLVLDRRMRFPRRFWAWSAAAVVGAVLGAPMVWAATRQSGQISANRLSAVDWVRNLLVNQWFLGDTPTVYVPGGGAGGTAGTASILLEAWKPAAVLLAAVAWALIGWGFLRWRRTPSPADHRPEGSTDQVPEPRLLLFCSLAVPSLLVMVYALAVSPIYNSRYLSFATPLVAVAIAAGVVRLPRGWQRWTALALIVVLAAPVYVSQRTRYAKSGADWSTVAGFVAGHRDDGPAGVYFAPRTPPVGGHVGPTSRWAEYAYPTAFAGMRDLTLVQSGVDEGTLLGQSEPLTAATGRLAGLREVFVIRRSDYPAAAVRSDAAVLEAAGFSPVGQWRGPLNTVAEYER